MKITYRDVRMDDEEWLLYLKNLPEIRCTSIWTRQPLSAGRHHKWLTQTLANPYRFFKVVLVNEQRAGTLRLQYGDIAIHLLPIFQRQGIGSRILRYALRKGGWHCAIRCDNVASTRLFTRFGFVRRRVIRRPVWHGIWTVKWIKG